MRIKVFYLSLFQPFIIIKFYHRQGNKKGGIATAHKGEMLF